MLTKQELSCFSFSFLQNFFAIHKLIQHSFEGFFCFLCHIFRFCLFCLLCIYFPSLFDYSCFLQPLRLYKINGELGKENRGATYI